MSWVTEFKPGSDHPRSSRVRYLAEPRNAREKQVPISDGRAGRNWVCPRARSPRAQSQEYRSRHSSRRPGRVYGRLRLRKIVACIRNALCGGAAAISRIGFALCAGDCFIRCPFRDVDDIDGLPPAVALQQQRGSPTTRSSVGSVTTLSNLLRMLYSRAGDYPRGQPILYAESFSPNTPEGACPRCHGLGRVYEVTEQSMVPDDSLTIRERAIAAWPTAWHGQNLRDIADTLGFDVDRPWRDLPKKDRNWLLFTDEQPTVPVYPGYDAARGSARAQTEGRARLSGDVHERQTPRAAHVRQYAKPADEEAGVAVHGEHRMPALPRQAPAPRSPCRSSSRVWISPTSPVCRWPGSPTSSAPYADGTASRMAKIEAEHPEKAIVAQRIAAGSRRPARRHARSRARLSRASNAAPRRFRPASSNGCGSPRRSARTCSVSSMCSTSRRPAFIRRIRRRC